MQWKILAGVRFFLAWIVFCVHLKWFVNHQYPLLLFAKFSGIAAVIGFFLISGYSIANSITRNPKGFYKRRILKIYPLYTSAIIFSLIPFAFLEKTIQVDNAYSYKFVMPTLEQLLGNLIFLQGFSVERITSNPVIWTLSIECLCYILAPIFAKLNNKIILSMILFSSLLYVIYPYLKLPYYSTLSYGLGFILLLWSWLLGFFYYLNQDKKFSKIILIIGGTLAMALNNLYFENRILGIATYVFTSIVLVYSPYIKLPKKILDCLNYLGNLSYSLYLFHVPSLLLGYSVIGIFTPTILVVFALLICIVFYHYVEIPLKSIKFFN